MQSTLACLQCSSVRITPGKITSKPEFVTSGRWEVAGIKKVAGNVVWFMGTQQGPETRHLYRLTLSSQNASPLVCVTCGGGQSCLFNSVDLSSSTTDLLWRCEGPQLPRVQLATLGEGQFEHCLGKKWIFASIYSYVNFTNKLSFCWWWSESCLCSTFQKFYSWTFCCFMSKAFFGKVWTRWMCFCEK